MFFWFWYCISDSVFGMEAFSLLTCEPQSRPAIRTSFAVVVKALEERIPMGKLVIQREKMSAAHQLR